MKYSKNLILFGIIIGMLFLFIGIQAFIKKDCFTEEHYFLSYENKNSSLCNIPECLFIYTHPVNFEDGYNRTFYFANENKELFYKYNDTIELTWCRTKHVGRYYIQNVQKKND